MFSGIFTGGLYNVCTGGIYYSTSFIAGIWLSRESAYLARGGNTVSKFKGYREPHPKLKQSVDRNIYESHIKTVKYTSLIHADILMFFQAGGRKRLPLLAQLPFQIGELLV